MPVPPGAETIKIGPAKIIIVMSSDLPLARTAIVDWVNRGAMAVSNYLGRFPVKLLRVEVTAGGDEAVGDGVTHGNSRIDVRLGQSARMADLRQDWVMTHEMFHLAFPTLDRRHLWMMEGLSDYLEPVARARAGQVTPEQAWQEFVEGFPQGLPQAGDHGLDYDHTRERIYWGGNIYWLLADVRIRLQTSNRRSVDDAIRAILTAGGNGGVDWPLDRVLSIGGKATGTTVLRDLYEQLGLRAGMVDLDALWKKLGVKYQNGAVTFDDTAPWARVRQSIMAPRGR
jgi:predicted metalloprotease with PDZ domain